MNPNNYFFDPKVHVLHDDSIYYPEEAPFNPSISYPEYFLDITSVKKNTAYDGIRNLFLLMGLDKENQGQKSWNPFKEIINPGDTVVIKPNFVASYHEKKGNLYSIITHPSLIRAVVDYIYIALKGIGKIIICDAPEMYCNFNELLVKTGLESIKNLYKEKFDFAVEILDLRDFWVDRLNKNYKGSGSSIRYKLPGDPKGGVLVNLGKNSLFYNVDKKNRFYGADFNREETISHHSGKTHEYMLSKTVLDADVVIFMPKLKVHKKVGITVNIKGLVGVNINKNYLIHYKLGTPKEGGDQYPDKLYGFFGKIKIRAKRWAFDRLLARKSKINDFIFELLRKSGKTFYKKLKLDKEDSGMAIDGGNWHGNDSAWRMACDLFKLILFTDNKGDIKDVPQRKIFSIVDGITCGQGDGPLCPDEKHCGLLISGYDLYLVDMVCTRLMGYDFKKIKMLNFVNENSQNFLVDKENFKLISNHPDFDDAPANHKNKFFDFTPPQGWKGKIEI